MVGLCGGPIEPFKRDGVGTERVAEHVLVPGDDPGLRRRPGEGELKLLARPERAGFPGERHEPLF